MGFLWFFLAAIIGFMVYALYRGQSRLKDQLDQLQVKFHELESEMIKYMRRPDQVADPQTREKTEPIKKPSIVMEPKGETAKTPRPSAKSPPPEESDSPEGSDRRLKKIEESLSSRWMVWVGGLAVALGGGFLVKYSIDSGLLSPLVRVSLGFVMGVILTIGGEILRQRRTNLGRSNLEWLKGSPDYLPGAISAAGLFSAFAAIYASYALYDILPAIGAFIALALLSFVASGLAWYQGRFFAYLGLIGGIIVPLLVSTGSENAWGLFPYLLVIICASLWAARQKAWIDVAATTLALGLLWVIIWIPVSWESSDIAPVGIYLLLIGALNSILLSGASPERPEDRSLRGMMKSRGITLVSDLVMAVTIILMVGIVRLDHYNITAGILVAAGLLAMAHAVRRSPGADMGGIMAIFGMFFLFATWHIPDLVEFKGSLPAFDRLDTAWAPTAPPGLDRFITSVLIFSGLTSLAIFMGLGRLMRRNVWASMGSIIPVVMLIITYWRIEDWGTSLTFAFAALVLACLLVLAVKKLSSEKDEGDMTPIAAYAAGATTMISLGIAMTLRDAWLSFALALQIAALAHIWRMTMVRGLRTLALILAAIVLIRLFLNGSIFDYGDGGPLPAFNWLFYGYALTAALFAYAARIFRPEGQEDRLMSVLSAGAIMLTIAFVSLELHVLTGEGGRLSSLPTELELALQTVNWVAATTILFWFEVKNNDALLGRIRKAMTFAGLSGLIIGGGLANNVMIYNAQVGTVPVFNLLMLQLLIPGLLYGYKTYIAKRAGKAKSMKLYGSIAFLVIWFWATAEVYNSFHPDGAGNITTDWEWYAYSLVWLVYAVILLLAGLRFQQAKIRQAGLAVLGIVVLKVFLVDMNQLEGLSRALSFMGLGGALIGLGYLYQKLNLKTSPDPEPVK
ncbi:hypothetical protein MNBD_ALPHA01-2412 [hydrothermal vent metagenome]|uniref:DUF2339 domain-containing protein n=1 Tax=hydrothermal vent metagenome TaxID=652676 RepID=A0A3B0T676_9ZZZZ